MCIQVRDRVTEAAALTSPAHTHAHTPAVEGARLADELADALPEGPHAAVGHDAALGKDVQPVAAAQRARRDADARLVDAGAARNRQRFAVEEKLSVEGGGICV